MIVRVVTADGSQGWGEADPAGLAFAGDTGEMVMQSIREGGAARIIGCWADDWVAGALGLELEGSVSAADDLETIQPRLAQDFRTFMLKMGSRSVDEDVARVVEVARELPQDARLMVDANQGWSVTESLTFVQGIGDLSLVLVERPVAADDHDGLKRARRVSPVLVSVDESLQTVAQAKDIAEAGTVDVFSIKISKNGGLRVAMEIGCLARRHGISILMNSMLELGITQAASLHLGCVLEDLVEYGQAYMSTLRMADDVTDFSEVCRSCRLSSCSSPFSLANWNSSFWLSC